MNRRYCSAAIAVLLIAPFVAADEVEVPTGKFEGRILSSQPEMLVIQGLNGEEITIPRDAILRIVEETEVQYHLDKGQHLENKGKDTDAYLEYLEVLTREPGNEEANDRIEEINLRHRRQRWQEGIDNARQLVAAEKYRQALRAFQKVLADQPEDRLAQKVVEEMCNTYAKIAFLYYNHCYDDGAIAELAKAEELNPNSAEIYYLLGRIHETDDQVDLARQEYERALELEPNHLQSRERLTTLIDKQRRTLRRILPRGL